MKRRRHCRVRAVEAIIILWFYTAVASGCRHRQYANRFSLHDIVHWKQFLLLDVVCMKKCIMENNCRRSYSYRRRCDLYSHFCMQQKLISIKAGLFHQRTPTDVYDTGDNEQFKITVGPVNKNPVCGTARLPMWTYSILIFLCWTLKGKAWASWIPCGYTGRKTDFQRVGPSLNR